jgi:hypothetical protein
VGYLENITLPLNDLDVLQRLQTSLDLVGVVLQTPLDLESLRYDAHGLVLGELVHS